jgi:hypothetical protein
MINHAKTLIDIIPQCDLCKKNKAKVDGKTFDGPWAYMCIECFRLEGIGIGLGKGQELIERECKGE